MDLWRTLLEQRLKWGNDPHGHLAKEISTERTRAIALRWEPQVFEKQQRARSGWRDVGEGKGIGNDVCKSLVGLVRTWVFSRELGSQRRFFWPRRLLCRENSISKHPREKREWFELECWWRRWGQMVRFWKHVKSRGNGIYWWFRWVGDAQWLQDFGVFIY